ncbi:MAG: hypothetical protein NTW03_15865, partial [Verrucomicrobia bacterium]|nr:hypothetical protein [Verrucomicrobiota bacterium]
KNRCWEYEQERRLIIDKRNFASDSGLMLLRVPAACVTALISGVRSSEEQRANLNQAAKRLCCPHYEMRIGRSSCIPYFVDQAGNSFSFVGFHIAKAYNVCARCSEPLKETGTDYCQWCTIDEDDEADAHIKNPFTMIDHLGLREKHGYGFTLSGIKPIGRLAADGAEAKAAPNVGPATQAAKSGIRQGPPSVS